MRGSVSAASLAGTITLARQHRRNCTAPGLATNDLLWTTLRIALTHAFCWPEVRRGAERFVPALGAALVRRGHEVLHYSAAWKPAHTDEDGVETIRLRRLFRHDYRHEADFGRRLLPRLALGHFDAVHSLGRHDAVASIRAARLRRDDRRTMFTDLGLPDRAFWAAQGGREARCGARVAGIDVYSGMSQTAVDYLAANYGRLDGVVVPGGVALGTFRPATTRELRPTILFSGAITERRKGVPVLLAALPMIAAREPEVVVWLSGPGDAESLLAEARRPARANVYGCSVRAMPIASTSATDAPGSPACPPRTTRSAWRWSSRLRAGRRW